MKATVQTRYVTEEIDAERTVAGGRIHFRTQTPKDKTVLEKVCPRDQARVMLARWEDGALILEPHDPAPVAGGEATPAAAGEPDERARLTALPAAELQELAAERGVTWQKKASIETMVDRILAAAPPAAPAE